MGTTHAQSYEQTDNVNLDAMERHIGGIGRYCIYTKAGEVRYYHKQSTSTLAEGVRTIASNSIVVQNLRAMMRQQRRRTT